MNCEGAIFEHVFNFKEDVSIKNIMEIADGILKMFPENTLLEHTFVPGSDILTIKGKSRISSVGVHDLLDTMTTLYDADGIGHELIKTESCYTPYVRTIVKVNGVEVCIQ